MLGSGIYSRPRKLNGLSTYSRHVGQLKQGGAIGVSLFYDSIFQVPNRRIK
jgi:hypothetical protein